MKINVLTLFPEMFTAVKSSILGRAEEKGILNIDLTNIRAFSKKSIKKLMSIHLEVELVCLCKQNRFSEP